ncbi:MAG: hypothetical protein EBS01_10500 [Verrucomicrobia bacterium]|nr:hypothetical protein [Verrucomicrobiota bacterium]
MQSGATCSRGHSQARLVRAGALRFTAWASAVWVLQIAAFSAPQKAPLPAAVAYSPGDLVRTVRKEALLLKGEPFLGAPKGQEFTVLRHEAGRGSVVLAFLQKEGGVVEVSLPEDALELVPPDGWSFLLRGVQAFREQRFEEARNLLGKAAQDVTYKPYATAVQARLDPLLKSAAQVFQIQADPSLNALPELRSQRLVRAGKTFADAVGLGRNLSFELAERGFTSLSFSFEEGLDRLGARIMPVVDGGQPDGRVELPPSRLSKEELENRARKAAFSIVRCRQAMAVRRMVEAKNYIEEGLGAEPARPELKAMQTKVDAEIRDAEDRYNAAASHRKRNLPQALLALERGLKTCADLPQLVQLREELNGVYEEKTAPPVNAAFLSITNTTVPAAKLEEGRRLYTVRCSQCHDLEMLDSRSASGWKGQVASMARRASLDEAQQGIIVEYLAAAQIVASQPSAKKAE